MPPCCTDRGPGSFFLSQAPFGIGTSGAFLILNVVDWIDSDPTKRFINQSTKPIKQVTNNPHNNTYKSPTSPCAKAAEAALDAQLAALTLLLGTSLLCVLFLDSF